MNIVVCQSCDYKGPDSEFEDSDEFWCCPKCGADESALEVVKCAHQPEQSYGNKDSPVVCIYCGQIL